jgi:hypothetical protein
MPKLGENVPKRPQRFKIITEYTNCSQNIPNDYNTYQHFPLQGLPKYTYKNWNFWLEILHLATLLQPPTDQC